MEPYPDFLKVAKEQPAPGISNSQSKDDKTSFGMNGAESHQAKVPLNSSGPDQWRALELLPIILGLPFILLIWGVIAVWIKIVSPGSVFYRQTRIGYKGQTFTIYKFRSMQENAATEGHEQHVADLMQSDARLTKLDEVGDARVIPGGVILRRSGLDELPQLINVLRGEMRLVGPRPCLECEFELYSLAQKERFDVTPGLTGYWQVNGKNNTTFAEMNTMDVHYVRNRSFAMDLLIVLRTPLVLIRQAMGRTPRVDIPPGEETTREAARTRKARRGAVQTRFSSEKRSRQCHAVRAGRSESTN